MTDLQLLNRVLQTKNMQVILQNNLCEEHFLQYSAEFNFILGHFKDYGVVPDKETFLAKFNDFSIFDVTESEKYLVEKINEEYLYYKAVPIIQKAAEMLKSDANVAAEFLISQIPTLVASRFVEGTDIIAQADKRLEVYKDKLMGNETPYIQTGFEELDKVIKGMARGEELVVLVARIGMGKTWVLTTILKNSWKQDFKTGLISPEMSPDKIGYRFDTLLQNFSNKNLVWGSIEEGYEEYIKGLVKEKNKFIVATPQDFQRKITVSKLKAFCENNQLDILGIDGITYLLDERYQRGDNRTTSLTNISEDLMQLSIDLKIPVIIAVQSNRSGVRSEENEDATPDLDNIRDSDGIAANATKVISIAQNNAGLNLVVKKHRDGITGSKLLYNWEINTGRYTYMPTENDANNPQDRARVTQEIKRKYDGEDVF